MYIVITRVLLQVDQSIRESVENSRYRVTQSHSGIIRFPEKGSDTPWDWIEKKKDFLVTRGLIIRQMKGRWWSSTIVSSDYSHTRFRSHNPLAFIPRQKNEEEMGSR